MSAPLRVTFVRHGQSTGNAGEPTSDLVTMPLTLLGWQQARAVATTWTMAPAHIVSSPFLRARQTAEPTSSRFPGVPLETWPVQEFTYLAPARWIASTRAQRRPAVEAYWTRADPAYVDGPGAESFSTVLLRADAALAALQKWPDGEHVVLFSHGQFMQAVRQSVLWPRGSDAEKMAAFWPGDQRAPVLNCQKVELSLARADGRWLLDDESGLRL